MNAEVILGVEYHSSSHKSPLIFHLLPHNDALEPVLQAPIIMKGYIFTCKKSIKLKSLQGDCNSAGSICVEGTQFRGHQKGKGKNHLKNPSEFLQIDACEYFPV